MCGFDAEGYLRRSEGYSPEPIRDAVWSLVANQVAGVVLDAGSGGGGWIRRLQKLSSISRIISVDIVPKGAEQLSGVEFHQKDLSSSALPVDDGELDWIFALEVIEHLANPRHFCSEAARALKPGGSLVLSTPCNDSVRSKLSFLFRGYFPAFNEVDYRESGHITPIFELDLERMATEAGFSSVHFFYPLPGLIPKLTVRWQRVLPFLKGRLWSDTLISILHR